MKKLYLATLFLFFLVQVSSAQFGSQYFDQEDPNESDAIQIAIDTASQNVWQIGMPQKTIFNMASTEPNAILTDTSGSYPANNTSRFIAKAFVNYIPFGIAAFQWKQKIEHHFNHYKDLKKPGSTKVQGWGSVDDAKAIIQECVTRYASK